MFDIKTGLFNSDKKMKYLKSIPISTLTLKIARFKVFAKDIEVFYNKDLDELTRDEMISGLENIGYLLYRTLRPDISIIADYIFWSQANKFSSNTTNIMNTINPYEISIEKYILKNIFKDNDSVVEMLEICYANPEEIIHSPIVCLLWLGLSIEEVLNLKNEDVDLNKKYIKGVDYIPYNILKILIGYNSDEFYVKDGVYKYVVKKVDLGFFLKKAPTKSDCRTDISKDQIRNYVVQKYNKITGNSATFGESNIILSGKLYRLYLKEQENFILEDSDFKKQFNISNKLKTQEDLLIRDFKLLYEKYKSVFWGNHSYSS